MKMEMNLMGKARSDLLEELKIQKAELEVQNKELLKSKLQLEHAHNKYYSLYNSAPIGFLTLSEIGDILDLNTRAAILLGKREESSLVKGFSSIFHKNQKKSTIISF